MGESPKRRRQEVRGERRSSEKWKEFGGQAEDMISVNNRLARIAEGVFFLSKLFIEVQYTVPLLHW